MEQKKRSGRPKKAENEKVQYQRIAVHLEDYLRLDDILTRRGVRLLDAFKEMVNNYDKRG